MPQHHSLDLVPLLIVIGAFLVIWLGLCYCLRRICLKCGVDSVLIWIPVLNIVPLLQAAGLPVWLFILFFIPLANLIMGLFMWIKIAQACNKSALLGILMIIPGINLIILLYLAFSE